MNTINYYPCTSTGTLLRGYCLCHGTLSSYLKDIRLWKSLGVKFVVMNGVKHSI